MSELISVFMLFLLKIEFKSFSVWCCILGFDYLLIFYCVLVYKNIHRMLIYLIYQPSNFVSYFVFNVLRTICVCSFTGGWLTYWTYYTLGGNSLSVSQQLTIAKSYMAKGGFCAHLPSPLLRFVLASVCSGFMCSVKISEFICATALLCPKDNVSLWLSTVCGSHSIDTVNDPWALGLSMWYMHTRAHTHTCTHSLRTELSAVSYSLYFGLCVLLCQSLPVANRTLLNDSWEVIDLWI